MLVRIFLVALVAGGLMIAIKSGMILDDADLLANCEDVAVPTSVNDSWQACTEGRLDGRRDLSDTCAYMGRRGTIEYWRCPPGAG